MASRLSLNTHKYTHKTIPLCQVQTTCLSKSTDRCGVLQSSWVHTTRLPADRGSHAHTHYTIYHQENPPTTPWSRALIGLSCLLEIWSKQEKKCRRASPIASLKSSRKATGGCRSNAQFLGCLKSNACIFDFQEALPRALPTGVTNGCRPKSLGTQLDTPTTSESNDSSVEQQEKCGQTGAERFLWEKFENVGYHSVKCSFINGSHLGYLQKSLLSASWSKPRRCNSRGVAMPQ